jgi:phage major head subunit gpT-like protein
MILNQANLSALQTSYKANFKTGWGRAEPQWSKVATLVPSNAKSNTYGFLGQHPQLRKWIGDRQVKSLSAHSYTLTNEPYEVTIEVPKLDIQTDQYGMYSTMFEEQGYASAMHPDSLVFALIASGATDLCYDGQAFFDASHPVVIPGTGASTKSNYDATGGGSLWALMDTRHPLKPMIFQKLQDYEFVALNRMTDEVVFRRRVFQYGVDAVLNVGFGLWQMAYGSLNTLNSTNVDSYLQAMFALKSDEGHPLFVRPNTLVIGPSNWAAANQLVNLQRLASGADNPYYKAFDIVMSPYLT